MSRSRDLLLVVAGAAAGVLAVVAATRRRARTYPKNVFVLTVTLRIKPGQMATWLKEWSVLADFCRAHEPRTLSYEAIVSDKEPDLVMVYERYVEKADLTEIHQKSAAFKAFGERMKELDIVAEKSGMSYYETNCGYM